MTRKKTLRKAIILTVSLMTVFANVLPAYATSNISSTAEEIVRENLALNKTTYVSSCEVDYLPGDKAVDGNRTDKSSRWASNYNDDEFITVDLGEPKTFNEVIIYWEAAYASEYKIQVSDDNNEFRTVVMVEGQEGEVATTFDSVTARYVRMQGVTRVSSYGYSIFEFEVYNNVDKTQLENAIKEFGGLEIGENPRYDQKEYAKSLNKATEVLDNSSATQKDVDNAKNNLEQRYWLVVVTDKNYKYSPKQENTDYSQYTTESIIPIVGAYIQCMNANTNTPTDKLKSMYELYTEAEKTSFVLAEENPERVSVGVNKDATTNADKKTGLFTIEENVVEVDGEKKIQLTIKFENTGIHPFTQLVKEKYTSTDLNKASVSLDYTLYEPKDGITGGIKSVTDIQPLDGSMANGFIAEMIVDPGIYTVYMQSGSLSKTAMPGYYYTSRSLDEVQSADKTILKQKLDEYREFNTDSGTFKSKLTAAVTAGDNVYNNVKATQEEVDAAVVELDRCYWMMKAADLRAKYAPLQNSGDRYEGYLTESVIPVMKVYMSVGTGLNAKESQAYYETYYHDLEEAGSQLVKAPENPEQVMIGIEKYCHQNGSKEAGQFTVEEEWVNDNGSSKIRLTVTFENTGIHPITGKEKTKFTADELKNIGITIKFQGGTKAIYTKEPLNESYDNGIVFTYDVEPGWYTFYLKSGSSYSGMPGRYYTSTTPTPKVDKSKLQALYDEVKSYVSEDYFYSNFIEKLQAAKDVLDDVNATQETVDKAHDELEQRYWLSQVNAYVGKYRPESRDYPQGFKYYEYEASSVMDVLRTQLEARNHTNANYPTESLKEYYNAFVEGEKKLVKVENPRDMMVGPTDSMINTSFTGHFTMTSEQSGDKIALHIEYFNDGLNPITGKEKEAFSFAETKKLRVYLDYRTFDGVFKENRAISSEIKPLDGKTDLTKGFQVDLFVDPGCYAVTVSASGISKKSNTIGSYYTVEFNLPPVIEGIEDGAYTNQDVTLTVTDSDLNTITVNGKEVTEDELTFTEDGKYTVVATDKAGNSSEVTFTIDKTAPTAIRKSPNSDGTISVKFNEIVTIDDPAWKLSDKQYEDDGRTWIGTLTENKIYEVEVVDLAGNVSIITIDHECPIAEVVYSTTEPTTGNVTVTIRFTNEENSVRLTSSTQNPGWTFDWTEWTYSKTFTSPTIEYVHFHDSMDNKTIVEVNVSHIDRSAPIIEGIKNGVITSEDVTLTVTDDHLDTITVNGKEVTKDELTFTEDGKYTVVATDKAGNSSEVTFTIDKTAAEIEGIENGTITSEDVTLTITDDVDTITVNGKEVTKDELTFTEDGEYTVVVIDKAGNSSEVTFTIDKTTPVIEGIENGAVTNEDVTLTITDDHLDTITVNGKEVTKDELTFTEDGEYTVVVTDKAGNSSEVTFTIQKVQNPVEPNEPATPANPADPVIPQRPTRPENAGESTEEIENNETPTPDVPNEDIETTIPDVPNVDIEDDDTPLAGTQGNGISMTTVCTVFFLLLLLLLIAYYCYKKMKEKNEGNAQQ